MIRFLDFKVASTDTNKFLFKTYEKTEPFYRYRFFKSLERVLKLILLVLQFSNDYRMKVVFVKRIYLKTQRRMIKSLDQGRET